MLPFIEKEGVPKSALILEKESTNTLENIVFGMRLVEKQKHISKIAYSLFTTTSYLQIQCNVQKAISRYHKFMEVLLKCPLKNYQTPKRMRKIIGEFDRLVEYSQKGDVAKVTIPEGSKSCNKGIKKN